VFSLVDSIEWTTLIWILRDKFFLFFHRHNGQSIESNIALWKARCKLENNVPLPILRTLEATAPDEQRLNEFEWNHSPEVAEEQSQTACIGI
jgi:hypothetical protein